MKLRPRFNAANGARLFAVYSIAILWLTLSTFGQTAAKNTTQLTKTKATPAGTGPVCPPRAHQEMRDWQSTEKEGTPEAYLLFLNKYPKTQCVQVLSGEVSTGFALDHDVLLGGVCVDGKVVSFPVSSSDLVRLGLADENPPQIPRSTACPIGITGMSIRGRTSSGEQVNQTVAAKTLPSAKLIMKRAGGTWNVVGVAPATGKTE